MLLVKLCLLWSAILFQVFWLHFSTFQWWRGLFSVILNV